MKNRLLITLLIVVLLVVYCVLGMDYLKQRRQQAALMLQIGDVAGVLGQTPPPPPDLEQRLASAQADLAAEQNAFLDEMNSTRVIVIVLKLADECGVTAIPVVTEPWSAVKVGEHDYNVFRLTVSVVGSYSNLAGFTDKLENGGLETLVVENLSVTPAEGSSGAVNVPGEDLPVAARLSLAIYTGPLGVD